MALIITGHQRTGTTLLAKLCNAHPQVRITGEFGNFLNVDMPCPRYTRRLLKRWGGIALRDWPLVLSFDGRGSNWDVLRQNNRFVFQYLKRIRADGGESVSVPVIEKTLRELLPGATVVGDKYPEYIWGLESLVATEGISVLVMYRDCRDVTSSTLLKARTDWRRMPLFVRRVNTAEKVARRWVKTIELTESHKDKIFMMRYEDLVTDIAGPLGKLAEWLRIDAAGFEIQRISSRSIGKYRRGLTRTELDKVMEIAGPTMSRLGYA